MGEEEEKRKKEGGRILRRKIFLGGGGEDVNLPEKGKRGGWNLRSLKDGRRRRRGRKVTCCMMMVAWTRPDRSHAKLVTFFYLYKLLQPKFLSLFWLPRQLCVTLCTGKYQCIISEMWQNKGSVWSGRKWVGVGTLNKQTFCRPTLFMGNRGEPEQQQQQQKKMLGHPVSACWATATVGGASTFSFFFAAAAATFPYFLNLLGRRRDHFAKKKRLQIIPPAVVG